MTDSEILSPVCQAKLNAGTVRRMVTVAVGIIIVGQISGFSAVLFVFFHLKTHCTFHAYTFVNCTDIRAKVNYCGISGISPYKSVTLTALAMALIILKFS